MRASPPAGATALRRLRDTAGKRGSVVLYRARSGRFGGTGCCTSLLYVLAVLVRLRPRISPVNKSATGLSSSRFPPDFGVLFAVLCFAHDECDASHYQRDNSQAAEQR